jgi:hypothetical protein
MTARVELVKCHLLRQRWEGGVKMRMRKRKSGWSVQPPGEVMDPEGERGSEATAPSKLELEALRP